MKLSNLCLYLNLNLYYIRWSKLLLCDNIMLETLDEKASLLKDRREDKKKKKEERRASEPGGCQTIVFPSLIAL